MRPGHCLLGAGLLFCYLSMTAQISAVQISAVQTSTPLPAAGFTASPQGLMFTADVGELRQATYVAFDVQYQNVDSIFIPQKVHRTIIDSEVKLTFDQCNVTQGKVIELQTPAK